MVDDTEDGQRRAEAIKLVRAFEAWLHEWNRWPDKLLDASIDHVVWNSIQLHMELVKELLGDSPLQIIVADMVPKIPAADRSNEGTLPTIRQVRGRIVPIVAVLKDQYGISGRGTSGARVARSQLSVRLDDSARATDMGDLS